MFASEWTETPSRDWSFREKALVMIGFELFLDKHGPAVQCRKADSKQTAPFTNLVPSELMQIWERDGFCGYANGFLWMVNPAELKQVLADWLPGKPAKVPIVRTAFGDLIYWDKAGAHMLEVQRGNVHDIVDDVAVVFSYWLCDDDGLTHILKKPLFDKAYRELGPIRHDECYAFKLALALGGDADVANLAIVKLREQLSILSQLNGNDEP